MIEFIVFAGVLTLASLVFVLLPLWRAGRPTDGRRRQANIATYHQRCAEIDQEVSAGRLSEDEAQLEKDRIGARLLADVDETPALTHRPTAAARPWVASVLAVVIVIGIGSGGYAYLGTPQAVDGERGPDVQAMIQELAQRVESQPDDLQARMMLARAQRLAGNPAAAAEQFAALNRALPDANPALMVAEAQSIIEATDDLQGRARGLFRDVLAQGTESAEALWYLGLAAAERGDYEQAVGYWDRLLALDLPDEFANLVRTRRAELAGDKPGLSDG